VAYDAPPECVRRVLVGERSCLVESVVEKVIDTDTGPVQ